ncbi:hypothetical protein C8R45DRAFT_180095 [Mycena sanguinolenta]|nr:hypothetical protein C8R45DRAFT_180095 [Mycena sanguinolenta]
MNQVLKEGWGGKRRGEVEYEGREGSGMEAKDLRVCTDVGGRRRQRCERASHVDRRIERLVSCPPHASSATLRIRSSALSSTSTSSLLRKRTSYRARASSGRRSASFPLVLCVSSHQALESFRHDTTASPPSRPEPSRTTDLGHRLPRDSAHTSQVGGARLSFDLHPKPKTLSTPLSAKPDDDSPIMHSLVGALERHSHTAADCAPPHHPHHTQSTPSRHALIDRHHEALRHVYVRRPSTTVTRSLAPASVLKTGRWGCSPSASASRGSTDATSTPPQLQRQRRRDGMYLPRS